MLIFSYANQHENEFNLRVNENCFAYERMSTKTHFENEAEVIRKWPFDSSGLWSLKTMVLLPNV